MNQEEKNYRWIMCHIVNINKQMKQEGLTSKNCTKLKTWENKLNNLNKHIEKFGGN